MSDLPFGSRSYLPTLSLSPPQKVDVWRGKAALPPSPSAANCPQATAKGMLRALRSPSTSPRRTRMSTSAVANTTTTAATTRQYASTSNATQQEAGPSKGSSRGGGPVKLPRLPVPDLRKTLDRYLTSLKPFLLEEEARGGQTFHEAYAIREKWADQFECGIGSVLQERLKGLHLSNQCLQRTNPDQRQRSTGPRRTIGSTTTFG